VWKRLKSYFKNKNKITKLYDNILDGKYSNIQPAKRISTGGLDGEVVQKLRKERG
jgi:hypothetical protein